MSDSPGGRSEDDFRESVAVTPDSAFAALANPQRRAVLSYLHERPNETVAVETLVEYVSQKCEADPTHRHVTASLFETHLPKLDDWNCIEYDRERRTVRYVDSPLVSELITQITETARS